MKTVKRLLPLGLVLLAVLLIVLLSGQTKRQVKKAAAQELNLLKNLDSETAQKYVSYEELFPNSTDTETSDDVMDVCTLLFQSFDYKIKKIDVDQKNDTASVTLKLTTLDAQSLARDYAAARLKEELLGAASADSSGETTSLTLSDSCRILKNLLTENSYGTTERTGTAELSKSGGSWEVARTSALENDLTGGLMTSLSDPDLLSPEDTLKIYLDTLKEMDESQMSAFLNVESLLNTDDESKNAIALALTEKVRDSFNYEIKDSSTAGYEATVSAEITTFDSDAIVSDYQSQLDTYLASADAVIDGADKRYAKSYEMLLSCIESSTSTITTQADFRLTNDGVSWKLADSSALGTAIFGTLANTLVENTEE